MKACIENTDSSVLTDTCSNVNEMNEHACAFISFREDQVFENKMFVGYVMKSSKELKRIPYERNVTFNDGNFDDLKNDGGE